MDGTYTKEKEWVFPRSGELGEKTLKIKPKKDWGFVPMKTIDYGNRKLDGPGGNYRQGGQQDDQKESRRLDSG